jgi:3-deoxy-manno-octulosonate cytidylyltransferase (CMP-KDO synthetase)
MADSDILIVIPARMASQRLPGKPLADIAGDRDRACLPPGGGSGSGRGRGGDRFGGDRSRRGESRRPGGRRTPPASGSDRIYEAFGAPTARRAKIIVNVPDDRHARSTDIRAAIAPLADPAVDIATLAAKSRARGAHQPNVVKVVSPVAPIAREDGRPARGPRSRASPNVAEALAPIAREDGRPALMRLRALYFTRATAPAGSGVLYHHIGLYAYRRAALARFVGLPPSALELRENLEQLRALEAGMRIDVAIVGSVPLGVDTPEDLERARVLLASGG